MTFRKRHKSDTKTFNELNWSEQSKSITATILQVEKVVKAHLKRAYKDGEDIENTRDKCLNQLMRMVRRLQQYEL
jgi:hypothetical protein